MQPRSLLLLAVLAVILANAVVFAAFWPAPSPPPDASPAQRLWYAHCVRCHGVDGRSSWRARILLIHPPDLTDPARIPQVSDQFLFDLIKQGGATIGKPGMPAFGSLSDGQIQDLVRFLRALPTGASRS